MRFLTATLLSIAAMPTSALACSCMMPDKVSSENLDGAVVFRGVMVEQEVVDSDTDFGFPPDTELVVPKDAVSTFGIRHLYFAEDMEMERVSLTHGLSSASCGRTFTKGQSVFVVARHWRGKLRAGLCEPFTEPMIIDDLASENSVVRGVLEGG